MNPEQDHQPNGPILKHLVAKMESLEILLGDVCNKMFPSLQANLEALHGLLSRRRKDHYQVAEIAELTGRSCYTVRRWITEKKIHAIRIRDGGPRGKLLIPRSEIERLIGNAKGSDIPDAIVN